MGDANPESRVPEEPSLPEKNKEDIQGIWNEQQEIKIWTERMWLMNLFLIAILFLWNIGKFVRGKVAG